MPARYDDIMADEITSAASELSSAPDLTPVGEVVVTASVEVGRRQLKISDALAITNGTIIQLEREIDTPLDLLINGELVARGEVVVVDNEFGLRVVEIIDGETEEPPAEDIPAAE